MKVIIENSTWNNIGDAFYQSTIFSLFKKNYPNCEILMGDGPIKRAFRPRTNKQFENMFQLMQHQKADYHVFSGPILKHLLDVYKEKIIEIVKRGANYALISVSSAGISEEECKPIGDFFRKYPPILFTSRDEDTFFKFSKYISQNCYNGICTAFLVGRFLPVDEIELPHQFFISSFYSELEPYYFCDKEVTVNTIDVKRKKTYLNLSHDISRHLNFLRPQQSKLGDHLILRVHNDLSTHYKHIKFSHPNSFMSFNPLSYLSLYKSTNFTISDRIHACAVTLAFGKPCRLFSDSPRAGIFNRLGYDPFQNNGVMFPNLDKLDDEIYKLENVIKKRNFNKILKLKWT